MDKSDFRRWYFWATHSRLPPIIQAAHTLKVRLKNILTYLKHPTTNASSQSINSKIQWIKYRARGLRGRRLDADPCTEPLISPQRR